MPLFDDLQTAALACMLINPDLPLESYTERYLKRFYPHASDILLPAYLSWERIVKEREALLPFMEELPMRSQPGLTR